MYILISDRGITVKCYDYSEYLLDPQFSGPPIITLSHGSINSLSLLPPGMNKAEVEVLTMSVNLSTNLVGRWQKPDNSIISQNSIIIAVFHHSDAGLYKFYVNSWDGNQILAIQIDISIIGAY